jgi:CBS domain containing-hemolysin-like protein
MIHSIFELGDTIVREVMVPRIDMTSVSSEATLQEILAIVSQHGHSRIPVYDKNIDNIIGIIHVKDLLLAAQNPDSFNLSKTVRKVYVVPEEKKVDDLLREFQKEQVHMAIVLDEYGGTAGLVTLEDIIEEIVGEIQDEYDKEQPLSVFIDERTVIASGRLSIYDLNQVFGHELVEESDAYDTVGGFVYSQLGIVPRRGDEFESNGYIFKVEELLGRRISRIKIEKSEALFNDA